MSGHESGIIQQTQLNGKAMWTWAAALVVVAPVLALVVFTDVSSGVIQKFATYVDAPSRP